MTIAEVFEYIDEFHPNTVSQSLKLRWINEAEGYIQREVMLRKHAELERWYRADDLNAVLLAPPPYDEQYVAYLDAKLFYLYHEITDYENAMERYNKIATDYAGWYARMYAPARPRGRWYRHHDDYIEEPLPPIEDGNYYYSSLAAAIADLSSGYQAGSDAAKEQAAVKVDPEDNIVSMLKDGTVLEPIDLTANMILLLNGYTVRTSGSRIFTYTASNPIEVEICGPGEMSVEAENETTGRIVLWGGDDPAPAESKLKISGGKYVVSNTQTMSAAFQISGGQLEMRNAEVYTYGSGSANTAVIPVALQRGAVCLAEDCILEGYYNGTGNATTFGVFNRGSVVTLRGCNIKVDAPYKCEGLSTDKCVNTDGVFANVSAGYTTLTKLYNCNIKGMHAAVSNFGTLYIDGGTYEAPGHGGLYAQGSSINHVKNATLEQCSAYGQFIGVINGAVLYLRGNSGNDPTVYLDNCTLPASSSWTQWIVMTTCSNAKLYVSNTALPTDRHRFIRVDQLLSGYNKIYSGENCDFDTDNMYVRGTSGGTTYNYVIDADTKDIFDGSGDTATVNDEWITPRYEKTSDDYAWEEE